MCEELYENADEDCTFSVVSIVKPAVKSEDPDSLDNFTSTETIAQHIKDTIELDWMVEGNDDGTTKLEYKFENLRPGRVDVVFPLTCLVDAATDKPNVHCGWIDRRILKIYGSFEYRDQYDILDQFVRVV
jgi:hypothetical protein